MHGASESTRGARPLLALSCASAEASQTRVRVTLTARPSPTARKETAPQFRCLRRSPRATSNSLPSPPLRSPRACSAPDEHPSRVHTARPSAHPLSPRASPVLPLSPRPHEAQAPRSVFLAAPVAPEGLLPRGDLEPSSARPSAALLACAWDCRVRRSPCGLPVDALPWRERRRVCALERARGRSLGSTARPVVC